MTMDLRKYNASNQVGYLPWWLEEKKKIGTFFFEII